MNSTGSASKIFLARTTESKVRSPAKSQTMRSAGMPWAMSACFIFSGSL